MWQNHGTGIQNEEIGHQQDCGKMGCRRVPNFKFYDVFFKKWSSMKALMIKIIAKMNKNRKESKILYWSLLYKILNYNYYFQILATAVILAYLENVAKKILSSSVLGDSYAYCAGLWIGIYIYTPEAPLMPSPKGLSNLPIQLAKSSQILYISPLSAVPLPK